MVLIQHLLLLIKRLFNKIKRSFDFCLTAGYLCIVISKKKKRIPANELLKWNTTRNNCR